MAAQPGDHLYQPQPGERVETQQEKEAKEARHGRARMSSTLSEVLPISHTLFVGKRIHSSVIHQLLFLRLPRSGKEGKNSKLKERYDPHRLMT
jgi:hypothetical protein